MAKRTAALPVCFLLLFLGSTAFAAHHGTNISYDASKPTTLTGTVTEFVWQNPHCQVYFDVKDAAGKITAWTGELNSPGVLQRGNNWTRRTLKAGDVITITLSPSKVGAPVGVATRIMIGDKEILGRGSNQ
jgi:hypothetical protein